MDAGTKNACPIPQSNPTAMSMGRVLEKESRTIVADLMAVSNGVL
jgi:hypothetical protein